MEACIPAFICGTALCLQLHVFSTLGSSTLTTADIDSMLFVVNRAVLSTFSPLFSPASLSPKDYAVSTLSAYLCWRAIERRRRPRAGAGQAGLPIRAPSSSTSSSDLTLSASDVPPPVPVPLKRLQLVLWNISCLAPLIAVTIFWGAVVSSACVYLVLAL